MERDILLKWGQQAFNNFRIVPPGTGICHQVNLEYLSKVVWTAKYKDHDYLFPDTLVGTDSHTTMVNGLSVLGWSWRYRGRSWYAGSANINVNSRSNRFRS